MFDKNKIIKHEKALRYFKLTSTIHHNLCLMRDAVYVRNNKFWSRIKKPKMRDEKKYFDMMRFEN